jgi:cell division septation protein DedD
MEDQTTWKNHTFTLFVFTGIVVLCSIFFILGMLMGRTQGQKLAANSPAGSLLKGDAKPAPKEDKPDFTFYESVKKEEPAVLLPAPAPEPPKKPAPAPVAQPGSVVHYQIGAVRKLPDAEKLLAAVQKKGFRAFILEPTAEVPYFRVQVGPFVDPVEAQNAKKKLETAGYRPYSKSD